MTKCKVGSIREIHNSLNEAGYKVSEYTLRLWARQGVLYTIQAGTKKLVSFDNVVSLLEGSTKIPPSA